MEKIVSEYITEIEETLEEITYKLFGSNLSMLDVLLSNNLKLAKYGFLLPIGTKVFIPAEQKAIMIKTTVNIWD